MPKAKIADRELLFSSGMVELVALAHGCPLCGLACLLLIGASVAVALAGSSLVYLLASGNILDIILIQRSGDHCRRRIRCVKHF